MHVSSCLTTDELSKLIDYIAEVVGEWLYIDGGQFSFLNNGTPQYEYGKSSRLHVPDPTLIHDYQATTILSIDLSQNWTNSTVAIHSTAKPSAAPNLNYPSLWYDTSRELFYSGYAGSSSSWNIDDPPSPPAESLWSFKPDNTGSGTWDQLSLSTWNTRTNRGYMAYGDGSAYVLGGLDLPLYLGGNFFPGMLQFDMSTQTFSNISSKTGATSPSGNPGYGGAMQYVPSFGPGGVFVVMGGADDVASFGFGSVMVFDPAGGAWYNQTTTGSAPAARGEFCTAGIASSNGTHEM